MEAPPKYVSPKGMWVSKLILRIISSIVAICILGLSGSLASEGIFGSIPFLVIGPPTIIALIWEVAEGICILARGGHRGIHPGANVALDLLLWLALVVCTTILGLVGLAEGVIGGVTYSPYSSYYDYDYEGLLSAATAKGQAILGLASTLTLLHFTTFVIACYETNVRNRMAHGPIIIVNQQYNPNMPPGQVMPMGMQPVYYSQVMPQHMYQQMPMQQAPMAHMSVYGMPPQDGSAPQAIGAPAPVYTGHEKQAA